MLYKLSHLTYAEMWKSSKKSDQDGERTSQLTVRIEIKEAEVNFTGKRRQREDLIEMYKILAGKEGVDPDCFFTLDKQMYNTRGWNTS